MATYNEFVKRPYEEHPYTIEEARELLKCSEDFYYFLKYVKIVCPDRGRISFDPYPYQMDIFDLILNNRYIVSLISRQSGKSTLVSVYLIWYAIFNDDKNIGVVSNNIDGAMDIVERCKLIYEELPDFLKPGIVEYNKKTMKFENGTTLKGAATSKNSFRGRTMNVILADELAFIEPEWLADAFYMSNYPTISKSKESKFIIISTPNGIGNLFHSIYSKAEKGTNAFKHYKADWRCVPERDEEWAKIEKSNIGKLRFNQEYQVAFLGSANTVIDEVTLKRLLDQPEPIPIMSQKGNFRQYEKPIQGVTYLIGVDCAKGTGEHFSTMQVFKLVTLNPIKLEQVAVFEDNFMDTYDFSALVDRTSKYYNDAYLMVENNGEGSAVISEIWWTHENEGLVCSGTKINNLGIRATSKTKPQAVILMKKLVEDGSIEIIDPPTINQLLTFIEKGNNKFTGNGKPDDLVSALYWMPWIFKMDILEDSMEFQKKKDDEDDNYYGEIFADGDPEEEGYLILQR